MAMSFTDVDECSDASLNDCDVNAVCANSLGGYSCTCEEGYTGDGTECSGKLLLCL